MSNPAGTIRRKRGVRGLTLGVILLVSALGAAGGARADNPVLTGNVGANDAFTITLTAGTYTFRCDPHASIMRGSFTVGPVTTPSPAPTPAPTPAATATKLLATIGPLHVPL